LKTRGNNESDVQHRRAKQKEINALKKGELVPYMTRGPSGQLVGTIKGGPLQGLNFEIIRSISGIKPWRMGGKPPLPKENRTVCQRFGGKKKALKFPQVVKNRMGGTRKR